MWLQPLPLFVGGLICALLLAAFCPNFPEPHSSTLLKMIKILFDTKILLEGYLDTFILTLPFENPGHALELYQKRWQLMHLNTIIYGH